jgi:hypothetical protein
MCGVVKCISHEHVSEFESLLNLEDHRLCFVTVSTLGFILERKLCFKNIAFCV